MSRDFSRITVLHVSRKNLLKRQCSEKQNIVQHLKTSQLNSTDRSSVKSICISNTSVRRSRVRSNAAKAINNSKQKKINHEGQDNPISTQTKKEINQPNLVDCPRDFLPLNSITNSTTCFDLSITHRSLNRNHRISPINCRNLFEGDFIVDNQHRNRKRKKNERKVNLSLWKIGLCTFISLLVIGGLIGILIYVFNQSKNNNIEMSGSETTTTTTSAIITTTQNSACTIGGIICPTPMFAWNRTHNCSRPAASYLYYSCCYQAVSTKLTMEFLLREDLNNWYIDDVSITQGNGQLLINGGFESNLTGWTVTSAITNLSVTPIALSSPSGAHTGSTYLHSEGKYAFDHIKQTVNVIQGQNVNISFWWLDEGGVPGPTEICEAIATLTP